MSGVLNRVVLDEKQVSDYAEHGFLVIRGLVKVEAIEALRQEVEQLLIEEHGCNFAEMKVALTAADRLRQCNSYYADSALDQLINSDEMLDLAGQLVGGKAVRYLPFAAVKAGGGGGEFHFHQDNNYTRHEPHMGSTNIWVALNAMTEANGCLRMVPGSHRQGTLKAEDVGDKAHFRLSDYPEEFLSIEIKAGDAVAFTRCTIHGSGPNDTEEPRIAYALQYHREDVEYFDEKAELWRFLISEPRHQTSPRVKA